MSRQDGHSSMCRRSEHVQCRASQAHCTCACHGWEPQAPPKARTLVPTLVPTLVRRTPVPKAARTPRPPKPAPVVDRPAIRLRPNLRKDAAACCLSRRDDLGRMPLGYCSPECVRRPQLVPVPLRPGGGL